MCNPATRPAFIPVPDTARVRMVYSSNGSEVMNVFHWKGSAPLSSADLLGLVTAVNTAWAANLKPRQINTCKLLFIEATALDAPSAPQVTLSVNVAGTASGSAAPNNVTFAAKFATGMTGRSHRGRMFFVGLNQAGTTGDQLDPTTAAAEIAAIQAFFVAVNVAVGYAHVVVSYCQDKLWLTTGAAYDVISYLLTDTNLDSQRRRLAGRGI